MEQNFMALVVLLLLIQCLVIQTTKQMQSTEVVGYVGHILNLDLIQNTENIGCKIFVIEVLDFDSGAEELPNWITINEFNVLTALPSKVGKVKLVVLIFGNNFGYHVKLCHSYLLEIKVEAYNFHRVLENVHQNLPDTLDDSLIRCFSEPKVSLLTFHFAAEEKVILSNLMSIVKNLSRYLELREDLIQVVAHNSTHALYRHTSPVVIHATNAIKQDDPEDGLAFVWPLTCTGSTMKYRHKLSRRSLQTDVEGITQMNLTSWHLTSGFLKRNRREVVDVFFNSITAFVGTPVETMTQTVLTSSMASLNISAIVSANTSLIMSTNKTLTVSATTALNMSIVSTFPSVGSSWSAVNTYHLKSYITSSVSNEITTDLTIPLSSTNSDIATTDVTVTPYLSFLKWSTTSSALATSFNSPKISSSSKMWSSHSSTVISASTFSTAVHSSLSSLTVFRSSMIFGSNSLYSPSVSATLSSLFVSRLTTAYTRVTSLSSIILPSISRELSASTDATKVTSTNVLSTELKQSSTSYFKSSTLDNKGTLLPSTNQTESFNSSSILTTNVIKSSFGVSMQKTSVTMDSSSGNLLTTRFSSISSWNESSVTSLQLTNISDNLKTSDIIRSSPVPSNSFGLSRSRRSVLKTLSSNNMSVPASISHTYLPSVSHFFVNSSLHPTETSVLSSISPSIIESESKIDSSISIVSQRSVLVSPTSLRMNLSVSTTSEWTSLSSVSTNVRSRSTSLVNLSTINHSIPISLYANTSIPLSSLLFRTTSQSILSSSSVTKRLSLGASSYTTDQSTHILSLYATTVDQSKQLSSLYSPTTNRSTPSSILSSNRSHQSTFNVSGIITPTKFISHQISMFTTSKKFNQSVNLTSFIANTYSLSNLKANSSISVTSRPAVITSAVNTSSLQTNSSFTSWTIIQSTKLTTSMNLSSYPSLVSSYFTTALNQSILVTKQPSTWTLQSSKVSRSSLLPSTTVRVNETNQTEYNTSLTIHLSTIFMSNQTQIVNTQPSTTMRMTSLYNMTIIDSTSVFNGNISYSMLYSPSVVNRSFSYVNSHSFGKSISTIQPTSMYFSSTRSRINSESSVVTLSSINGSQIFSVRTNYSPGTTLLATKSLTNLITQFTSMLTSDSQTLTSRISQISSSRTVNSFGLTSQLFVSSSSQTVPYTSINTVPTSISVTSKDSRFFTIPVTLATTTGLTYVSTSLLWTTGIIPSFSLSTTSVGNTQVIITSRKSDFTTLSNVVSSRSKKSVMHSSSVLRTSAIEPSLTNIQTYIVSTSHVSSISISRASTKTYQSSSRSQSSKVHSERTSIQSSLFTSSSISVVSTSAFTGMPDTFPRVTTSIGFVFAETGQLFRFKVPENTFIDKEDGGTRNLSLSSYTNSRKALKDNPWLLFNSTSQLYTGVPLFSDFDAQGTTILLMATDRSGNSVLTQFQMFIMEPPKSLTFAISLKLALDYKAFIATKDLRVELIKRISTFYGMTDASGIYIQSIKEGSTIVSWSNTSLRTDTCDFSAVSQIISTLEDSQTRLVSRSFVQYMLPEFPIIGINSTYLGPCLITPTKSPVEQNDVSYLNYTIPLVVLTIVIFIVIILMIFLWRKRKKRKFSMRSYEKGRPVLLPDEIELKALPEPIQLGRIRSENAAFEHDEVDYGSSIGDSVSSYSSDEYYPDHYLGPPPAYAMPPPYKSPIFRGNSEV